MSDGNNKTEGADFAIQMFAQAAAEALLDLGGEELLAQVSGLSVQRIDEAFSQASSAEEMQMKDSALLAISGLMFAVKMSRSLR